MSNWDH
jgi:hypothetical protein